MIDLLLNVSRA